MLKRKMTEEEYRIVILKIELFYSQGMTLRKACEAAGISPCTYYKYQKEGTYTRKAPH